MIYLCIVKSIIFTYKFITMKNHTHIFGLAVAFALAFTITACKPTPDPEPAVVTQGLCVPLNIKNAAGVFYQKYEYDATHRLVKYIIYNTGIPSLTYILMRNAAGVVTALKAESGTFNSGVTNITYTANGNATMAESLDSNNVIRNKQLYFYDAQNRLIRQERYRYDTNGVMIDDGNINLTYTGANRRPTRIDRYIDVLNSRVILYEYDSNMNKTKVSQYQNGSATVNQEDIYIYDNKKSVMADLASIGRFAGLPPENYYNGESDKNNVIGHIIKSYYQNGTLSNTITDPTKVYSNLNANNYPLLGTSTPQTGGGQPLVFNIEYDCY
jgi:hypothetical protein